MAMRASLARALVTEPRLLLLDEPFAALDEITRRALADDVLALWATTRPTIVFVTHNVEEAIYMAQRLVVMTAGPGRPWRRRQRPSRRHMPRKAQGFRTTPLFRDAAAEAVFASARPLAMRARGMRNVLPPLALVVLLSAGRPGKLSCQLAGDPTLSACRRRRRSA